MKICKNCKTKNDDNAKFCRSCGSALEKNSKGETMGAIVFWTILIGGAVVCGILGIPFIATVIISIVLAGLGILAYSFFDK